MSDVSVFKQTARNVLKYIHSLFAVRKDYSEMTSWRGFAKFATLILVFVIILVMVFRWKNMNYNEDCGAEACVRTCCKNETCLFDDSIKSWNTSQKLSKNFIIFNKKLSCDKSKSDSDDIWNFEKVVNNL